MSQEAYLFIIVLLCHLNSNSHFLLFGNNHSLGSALSLRDTTPLTTLHLSVNISFLFPSSSSTSSHFYLLSFPFSYSLLFLFSGRKHTFANIYRFGLKNKQKNRKKQEKSIANGGLYNHMNSPKYSITFSLIFNLIL